MRVHDCQDGGRAHTSLYGSAPHRDSRRDDGSSVQADIGGRVYDKKAKPGVPLGILVLAAPPHPVFISHTSISCFEVCLFSLRFLCF